jgi:chain length determinant protein tyrosine kinase EpsG
MIGEILAEMRGLTNEQIDAILDHQNTHGIRFGEAAVALGLVTEEEVLYALSQQFHYYYGAGHHHRFSAELVVASRPFSRQADAFRNVRSQLMLRLFGQGPHKLALSVVSVNRGDGRTFFAANTAVALSQLGGRTLLLDADLRSPRVHDVFGLQNVNGLSTVLSGRAEVNVIQQIPGLPALYVMCAGPVPPNPQELTERTAFELLLRELTSKFDHVVVDTPAAVQGADPVVIASRCGAALVVARKGETRVGQLQEFVNGVSEARAQVAGVIMNEF